LISHFGTMWNSVLLSTGFDPLTLLCIGNECAFDMPYVRDEGKRASNLGKHSVDFLEAAQFEWDTALTAQDVRYPYPEPRFFSIGLVGPRV
jgi:hypothetical protein